MEIINGAFSSGVVEHHCILSDFVVPTIYVPATGKHNFVLMGGVLSRRSLNLFLKSKLRSVFGPMSTPLDGKSVRGIN